MLKCFLSYKYDEKETALVGRLAALLRVLNVTVVEGRDLRAAQPLAQQIEALIAECDLLLCLKLSGDPASSVYIDQEAGFAHGRGLPIVLVVEDSSIPRGLFTADYYVSLDKGEMSAAVDLANAVQAIKKSRNLALEAPPSHHSLEALIDKEGWSPGVRGRLRTIRELINALDFVQARQEAKALLHDAPNCWRAAIAIAGSSMNLTPPDLDEAEKTLDQILVSFTGNARALSFAWHNKATVILVRNRGGSPGCTAATAQAAELYRRAIDLEPRFFTFVDLVECLVELGQITEDEATFAECLNEFADCVPKFRQAVEARGGQMLRELSKSRVIMNILYPKHKEGDGHE